MKYRAICFDFDYTLGDSTDSIVAGFQYGFTRLGWPAPDRETVRRTVGYLLEDAYTLLTGDRDPEHRAAFRPLFLEASMERQRRETTLFPGAPELLRELKARGIRLGIVSTKRSDTLEAILENRGVLGELDLIIGSDRVKRHKPDPEGLLAAMSRLGGGAGGDFVLWRHGAGCGGGPKCRDRVRRGAQWHHAGLCLPGVAPCPHRPGPLGPEAVAGRTIKRRQAWPAAFFLPRPS